MTATDRFTNVASTFTRRKPRTKRDTLSDSLTSSGNLSGCSTALWEGRTSEARDLSNNFKFYFDKYDVNDQGKLSIDSVFAIMEEACNERPSITSSMCLVRAFSADHSEKLNLAEFSTMMHFIGESGNMTCYSFGCDEDQETSLNVDDVIATAIKMHAKSNKTTIDRLVSKLGPIQPIVNMKNVIAQDQYGFDRPNPMDPEFSSAYGPNQMRCIALVSHNGMKETMKKFVVANKNVLKKFRLTGTASTMKMLQEVFDGDNAIVFGPSCASGPMGGDAQLVAMLCQEQLGGCIFFQDPLDSHPHTGDIESLLRNTKIYNIMHASNTMTATMMMHTLREGLENEKPELLPSFFQSFECSSVARYQKAQGSTLNTLSTKKYQTTELEELEIHEDLDMDAITRGEC